MVDREESRLKEMKLTKLTEDDAFISHDDDWESRKSLHDDLKNSNLITSKPTGNYFEFEENSVDKDYISCHLIIPVVVSKVKPLVAQSAYLESEESEENEEENEDEEDQYDLGVGPTAEEIAAAKKARGTFASSGVRTTKDSEKAKKEDLRRTELVAEYDWAMEEAAAWKHYFIGNKNPAS